MTQLLMACVLNNQTCRLITVYYYRDMNLAGIHHDQVHVVPSSMPTTYIQVRIHECYMYRVYINT